MKKALQGLVFWIGYRRALFVKHPLAEAALVAEACCLIQANLPESQQLLPERMYSDLVLRPEMIKSWGQKRADLVVCEKQPEGKQASGPLAGSVCHVIEVKRGSTRKKAIDEDILRLSLFLKNARPGARAFLFQLCEGSLPKRFVNHKTGKARTGNLPITVNEEVIKCGIRRVLKAASSFEGKETANYAVVVEVFREEN